LIQARESGPHEEKTKKRDEQDQQDHAGNPVESGRRE
jgi:hypothetical protein